MTAAPHADVASQLSAILAGHQVVDLSLPLAEELPCTWPGRMPFRCWLAAAHGELRLVDGTGAPGRALAVPP